MTRHIGWLAVLCIGCSSDATLAPVPDLPRATDMNPDPNIVEVTLVATAATTVYADGRVTEVLAYRDGAVDGSEATVPGPMIEAKQGNRLIVHFRNELTDRESSVHWHGLRLPIEMDGVDAIAAGASFDYDFTLLDAGWFWYHPHIETDEQIELGLQGQLLVHGASEPAIARERMFVFDDVDLDDRGQVRIQPSPDDLALGRRGDTLLVNGKPPGTIVASPGSVERWRLVNTSNGRFFDLRLDGLAMRVIGWDGGLIPEPYNVDHLLIAPGERYDVVVALDRPRGSALKLQTLALERGHGGIDRGPLDLVRVDLDGDDLPRDQVPVAGPSIAPLPVSAQTLSRRFALSELLDGPQGAVFFINNQRWPLNTPADVSLGDLVSPLTSITESLKSIGKKNTNNSSSLSQMLPLLMLAKGGAGAKLSARAKRGAAATNTTRRANQRSHVDMSRRRGLDLRLKSPVRGGQLHGRLCNWNYWASTRGELTTSP